jgi:hypothetical protein
MTFVEFEPQRLTEESAEALRAQLENGSEHTDKDSRIQTVALMIAKNLTTQLDVKVCGVAEKIAEQLLCPEIKDEIIKSHRVLIGQTVAELTMSVFYDIVEADAARGRERNRPRHKAASV